MWCENPVAYIGTYPKPRRDYLSVDAWDTWNYDDGETIRVVCYTNQPQARLLLNGKEVGAMKPYNHKSGIIHWDIPYAPGKLTVEACDNDGNVTAGYDIVTSGRPFALKASADKPILKRDKATAHVFVDILDDDGNIVTLGDNEITCTIQGPARLLGLEGCNNSDMSDYTDNRHRAYRGRLLAYIQTTGEPGEITVNFTSPLLKGTKVKLTAE